MLSISKEREKKKMHEPSMEQGCTLGRVQYPSLVSSLLLPRKGEEFVELGFSVHFNRN